MICLNGLTSARANMAIETKVAKKFHQLNKIEERRKKREQERSDEEHER